MAEPIHPEQWQELLAGYALGDLTPEEAEQLQHILASHPECVKEMHQLQVVLAAVPYALPEVSLPEHLRSAILQVASQSTEVSAIAVPPRNQPRQQRRSIWLAIGTVAALCTLAFGLDNYRLRQELANTRSQVAHQKDLIAMLQEPKTRLVTLKGTDSMAKATGNVVITPGQAGAIVVLQDLPSLPTGQNYQLWAVVNGQKVATGQFTATPQGRVFVKVPFTADAASGVTSLVVTIEVSPTPVAPQGPMVMTSSS